MKLTGTNQSVELVTATAVSTDWAVYWTDIDKSGADTAILPGSATGNVSSAMTTSVVAAPSGASIYREITAAQFYNAGAGSQTLTVQRDIAGTNRLALKVTLGVGESLHYERGRGWYVLTAVGEVATVGARGTDGSDGAGAVVEVEIDFGASTTDVATLVVSDAGISASSVFLCGITGGSTTDNNADAHALMAHLCTVTAVPGSGSVTFTARTYGIRATGLFKLRYTYS